MKSLKLVSITLMLILLSTISHGRINRLSDEKEKNAVENSANKGKSASLTETQQRRSTVNSAGTTQQDGNTLEMGYAKSDFVTGDEIIFEDLLMGFSGNGEYPKEWNLRKGKVEVSKLNGENTITLFNNASLSPLIRTPTDYLTESYSIELDVYIGGLNKNLSALIDGKYCFDIKDQDSQVTRVYFWGYAKDEKLGVVVNFKPTKGEDKAITDIVPNIKEGWHHLAISFKKTTLKVFVDGYRVIRVCC